MMTNDYDDNDNDDKIVLSRSIYNDKGRNSDDDDDDKEIITDNKEDGTNYHCQGIRGATILPSHSGGWR